MAIPSSEYDNVTTNLLQGLKMKVITIAKYIDQPVVLSKLHSKMPLALGVTGAGVWGYETFHKKTDDPHKTRRGIKNAIIIGSTMAASLMGAKGLKIGGKKIFKGLMEAEPLKKVLEKQAAAIDDYIANAKTKDETLEKVLIGAKTRKLSLKDIETIDARLPKSEEANELLDKILPSPENLNSKEIFSEIKRLSLIGAVPVIGGVVGGVAADSLTGTRSKKSTANKVKEGVYQYLANIFLCNVGAGAALFTAEKLVKSRMIKPLTSVKKLFVILSGITATGIIGGSFIANYLSKKFIDPMFEQKHKCGEKIYSERKPEPLDVALHADDIATAGVLSGFKWIEPALPIMYFVSGYRAGIGYRNNCKH